MKKIVNLKLSGILLLSVLLSISACRKSAIVYSVTDAVNMTQYFDEHPEEFSELSRILRLSGTAPFLNAYGSYTMFAPTNSAIKQYLQDMGKTDVEQISGAEWKDFVRFHLMEDSIASSRFVDGKLPKLTMYGQYLVAGSENVGGFTKLRINRQANVIQANISVGNGLIHTIDHVLTPAKLSLAQLIEADGRYTIFTEALKETGLYDTLNVLPANNPDEKKKWLTVIAETDEVLQAAGFNSYDALKAKFSNTGDPKLPTDSLHLFVNYHILYGAKYVADIIMTSAHNTLAPLEVLTAKLSGEVVLMNDDVFMGVHEPGFELIRNKSDMSATNGVLHETDKHFKIKKRSPFRVDFDVCTFPELVKNTEYYGKKNYEFTKEEAAAFSEVRFSGTESGLIYRFGSGQGTSKTSYNQDILVVPLAAGGTSSRAEWVEFKTPLLVRGKYKVWVGYYVQRQSSSNGGTFVDAQALIGPEDSDERTPLSNARILSFVTKRPGMAPDVEEAIGWKIYMETTTGSQSSRLMGVADIPQTGRYWIRLQAVNGSQTTNNIDLIQFIPVDEDQQYPRFKIDGSYILRDE